MRRIVIFLLAAIVSVGVFAQNNTPWHEMVFEKEVNLYEVTAAFEEQTRNLKGEELEAHAKHFNRWKHRVLGFAKPNGDLLTADERSVIFKDNKAFKKANEGNWKEIGPVTAKNVYRGVGRINCIAFHPTDSNIMYLGAPYGGVWKTTDHGANWENLTDHLPSFGVSSIAVHPDNPNIIYIGTGDGETGRNPGFGVWKSEDGGKSWETANNGMGNWIVNEILIFSDNGDELLAATNGGYYRTLNGGGNWIRVSAGNFRDLRFKPGDEEVVYLATTGQFFVSVDRGRSVEQKQMPKVPSPRLCLAVSAAEPEAVYMVSAEVILKSEDQGETINVFHEENGDRGLGSQSWYNSCAEASPVAANTLYQGHVPTYYTSNGGVDWKAMTGVHSDVHYIRHSPITKRLWLAGDGGIMRLSADGRTFVDHTNLGVSEIYEMGQHPFELDHMLNGYQDCGSKYYTGNRWISRVGADGIDCIFDPVDPTYYFTTIQYGDIRRHIGGPDGKVSNFPDPQDEGPWVSPIWVDIKDPNILYTGQNAFYRYRNAREDRPKKDNWETLDNGLPKAGEYLEIEQNEAAPQIMYVSNGSFVFRTWNVYADEPVWENLAGNYPATAAVLDIESSPSDSDLLIISMNRKVFRSTDGGESFTQFSEGLPDRSPIYALQFDHITGHLYSGTEAGIFLLLKGDSVWREFNQGMSLTAPVYDLEIFYNAENHDNSMIKAATFGRGMWESPLYGSQPDPTLPFYAFISSNQTLLERADFELDINFRRGFAYHDVKDFTASAIEVENAEVVSVSGSGAFWKAKFRALEEGEVSIHIPEGVSESAETDGLRNLASEVLKFNFAKGGTSFGYEGPGGVGSKEQLALWLDAETLTDTYSHEDEVKTWTDKMSTDKFASQIDTLKGPILWLNDTLFGGYHAMAFDSSRLTKVVADSIVTTKNISAITVAASDEEKFNDHAWMGSSRDENGFIVHNWRDNKYARMYAYDSTQQNISTPRISVSNVQKANIYGLSYRNNLFIWNYTNDQQEMELVSTPKPRHESHPIKINFGWDKDQRYGNGMIAEFILLNEAMMLSHRTIVYNYLSAKYDISIPAIDYYSFEESHDMHVAGIGRETEIDLHTDAMGTGMLRINTPDDLGNGEYLFWGQNREELQSWSAASYLPGSEQSLRTWMFDEKGDVGQVSLMMPAEEFEEGFRYFLVFKETKSDDKTEVSMAELKGDGEWMVAVLNPEKGSTLQLVRIPDDANTGEPKLYPNPIQNSKFSVYYDHGKNESVLFQVYDLKGRIVWEENRNLVAGDLLHSFDIYGLENGEYIFKMHTAESEFTQRILVVE